MTIATFDFEFPGYVATGRCDLTIDTDPQGGQPSVVCSQKRNYTGTSITNALEEIALKLYVDVAEKRLETPEPEQSKVVSELKKFWKKHKPNGLRDAYGSSAVRWIEHYPAGTGLVSGDTFREVVFDSEDSPLWLPSLDATSAKQQFGTKLIAKAMESK